VGLRPGELETDCLEIQDFLGPLETFFRFIGTFAERYPRYVTGTSPFRACMAIVIRTFCDTPQVRPHQQARKTPRGRRKGIPNRAGGRFGYYQKAWLMLSLLILYYETDLEMTQLFARILGLGHGTTAGRWARKQHRTVPDKDSEPDGGGDDYAIRIRFMELVWDLVVPIVLIVTDGLLIETDDGYLGVGPEGTRPGDLVCILGGSTLPILLRPTGKGQYLHVGPAYVLGFMNGEAINNRTELLAVRAPRKGVFRRRPKVTLDHQVSIRLQTFDLV
jgi:hypothetical protein